MDVNCRWFRAFFALPLKGVRRTVWFYRTRGANFIVFGHPFGFVQVPWFWSRAALESLGYDRGWNAGYESGWQARGREKGA